VKLVDRVYDIRDFEWVSDENALYNRNDYVIYYINNTPNYADGRRQFYILNTETNNKHRFRFKNEFNGYNLFVSENGVNCKIKLKGK
jgi:hypothetical protein